MIVEIASNLTPRPIVVDTDAPSSGGGVLPLLQPSIRVLSRDGGSTLMTWSPEGEPAGSILPALLLAAVLGLAVYGAIALVK